MSANQGKTIFCEGKNASLDSSLLNRILEDCKTEAIQLFEKFASSIQQVNIETLQENIEKYLGIFDHQDFWDKHQYLIWFNAKDLQKAMQRSENNYISLKPFFNWSVQKINIEHYDDLVELKNKIQELISE